MFLHGPHITDNRRQSTVMVSPDYGDIVLTDTTVGGQNTRILAPENGNNGALCIYHHGLSESSTSVSNVEKAGIVDGLGAEGWIVAASHAHGDNWGNPASVADYVNLYEHLASEYGITKVVHFAQSMGGLSGLTTVANTDVPSDGFLGIYPVCSLDAVHSDIIFQNGINNAYSADNSSFPAASAGYDPLERLASAYANVPMRFYASPDDTLVPKADHTDPFAALIDADPAEHEVVVCEGEHGDAPHFQTSDALAFFARCIA